jgi:hypothetical protein
MNCLVPEKEERERIHQLLPILKQALDELRVLPERDPNTKAQAFKDMNQKSENCVSKKAPARKTECNQNMSQISVKVEHAISDISCSRIVKDILRNAKNDFSDGCRIPPLKL